MANLDEDLNLLKQRVSEKEWTVVDRNRIGAQLVKVFDSSLGKAPFINLPLASCCSLHVLFHLIHAQPMPEWWSTNNQPKDVDSKDEVPFPVHIDDFALNKEITTTLPILCVSYLKGSLPEKRDICIVRAMCLLLTACHSILQYPIVNFLADIRLHHASEALGVRLHCRAGAFDKAVLLQYLGITPQPSSTDVSTASNAPAVGKSNKAKGSSVGKKAAPLPVGKFPSPSVLAEMCRAPLDAACRSELLRHLNSPDNFVEAVGCSSSCAALVCTVYGDSLSYLTPLCLLPSLGAPTFPMFVDLVEKHPHTLRLTSEHRSETREGTQPVQRKGLEKPSLHCDPLTLLTNVLLISPTKLRLYPHFGLLCGVASLLTLPTTGQMRPSTTSEVHAKLLSLLSSLLEICAFAIPSAAEHRRQMLEIWTNASTRIIDYVTSRIALLSKSSTLCFSPSLHEQIGGVIQQLLDTTVPCIIALSDAPPPPNRPRKTAALPTIVFLSPTESKNYLEEQIGCLIKLYEALFQSERCLSGKITTPFCDLLRRGSILLCRLDALRSGSLLLNRLLLFAVETDKTMENWIALSSGCSILKTDQGNENSMECISVLKSYFCSSCSSLELSEGTAEILLCVLGKRGVPLSLEVTTAYVRRLPPWLPPTTRSPSPLSKLWALLSFHGTFSGGDSRLDVSTLQRLSSALLAIHNSEDQLLYLLGVHRNYLRDSFADPFLRTQFSRNVETVQTALQLALGEEDAANQQQRAAQLVAIREEVLKNQAFLEDQRKHREALQRRQAENEAKRRQIDMNVQQRLSIASAAADREAEDLRSKRKIALDLANKKKQERAMQLEAAREKDTAAYRKRIQKIASFTEYIEKFLKVKLTPEISAFLHRHASSLTLDVLHEFLVTGHTEVPKDVVSRLEGAKRALTTASWFEDGSATENFWEVAAAVQPTSSNHAPTPTEHMDPNNSDMPPRPPPPPQRSFHMSVAALLDTFDYSPWLVTDDGGRLPDPIPRSAFKFLFPRDQFRFLAPEFEDVEHCLFTCVEKKLLTFFPQNTDVGLTPLGAAYHAPYALAGRSFTEIVEARREELRIFHQADVEDRTDVVAVEEDDETANENSAMIFFEDEFEL